ncbi:sucrase ferredoxin [Branchiibius sp. NY16-3462-2]|uniref:sucrase ferredoxin n=1 Tax=Branchiibius sp. NY16-3462-2 TaxID=1807500 RepID=UPI00079C8B11|nr:sucrase ferredoxin [Branchiibius sp. NY16-3462-2]KYH44067.1 hypothetical protein AZH51_04815 [Branchiibius sp. NY16-3462-2]
MTQPLPDSCSAQWDDAGLPALGTASQAAFWVALEQNGPWGREAVTESHLDPSVGSALAQACSDHGGRLLLIRRPGRHVDVGTTEPTVLIAGGLATDPWLLVGTVDDPAELLRTPWSLLAGDDPDAVTETLDTLDETRDPALLICTNSKRDVCCAVRGRPIALSLQEQFPERVWECSHTGGHRFAPTGIALPSGQTYARLTTDSAAAIIPAERKGEIPVELNHSAYDRGRSVLAPPAQSAESVVRQSISELSLRALRTDLHPDGEGWRGEVTHRDGRAWPVDVRRVAGPELKDSCVKVAKPSFFFEVSLAD